MLTIALHTLRTRWSTFLGTFVALSLGVALLAVMGLTLASSLDAPDRRPERFATAPVVVRGQDTLSVPTSVGAHVSRETRKLAHPRAVPEATVAKLMKLGTVIADRSFPVHTEGVPRGLIGHPWSTAAFAPYEITAGRAPRTPGEVVTADWARPGQQLHTRHGTVTVVGTVSSLGFENPVFYTDARAAELSPESTQLVVEADATDVRQAAEGESVHVLTGNDRHLADPDPDRDREALTAMNALFGTAGGVTAFVSVFVVASTFAFAVAQRRREFGLLRTAGATPGQIRRTVCAEALLVGVLASATGCVVGAYGAPHVAEWAVDVGLAPGWFTIGDSKWPYHMAFWTGLLVALLGVIAASWRAGRVGPTQALREASVDAKAMTRGRLLCGAGLLLAAVVTLVLSLVTDPGELLHRKTYVSRPMLLITAVALLAPALVRPLTRLVAWLPAQLPGADGMLVRENAAAGVRRTAAVAAPVLVTVALTGSLLGATATLNDAKATETRERTTADFVVVPAGNTGLTASNGATGNTGPTGSKDPAEDPGADGDSGPAENTGTEGDSGAAENTGFDAQTLQQLRTIPGITASATSSSAVYVLEDGVALIRSEARAAEPAPLAVTADLPLAAGKVSDLDDGSIIVNEEWERHTVGQTVDVWLGDGTRKSLRIAAVMTTGTGDNGVYVTPANAPGAHVDRVDVTLIAGADPAVVADELRKAGGHVLTRDQWVRASHPGTDRNTRYGFLLVLGIALLYTGISLANTMVMAASDRVRDLAVLRLAGATHRQVLRVVGAEALTVVAVGGVLGLLVTTINLAGMRGALGLLSVHGPMRIPWPELASVTGACAVLAVVFSVAPAAWAMRRRTVELAGTRE
ncbi:putative ABC transport system permease protein [Streptomyces canus]|uniref:ABC transport system permease protein n=1 Tax=Streptomyces canus TaxID=58343 RepID=A0AAW8FJH8_9ACTN|nr:FtsX-like permease family protein [Streptomyces canus]MDQ0909217.1 putative ABC transport system permease protein [Streptomyces canus]